LEEKMKYHVKGLIVSFLLMLTVIFGPSFFARGADALSGNDVYEKPADRRISDILAPDKIQGPHYKIRDKVTTYGYMHRYSVDSDFGTFTVTGDGALRKLLREIRAIADLKKTQESDSFKNALKEAGEKPLKFGESLVNEPVDTISGIPKGVYSIFESAYTSLTTKRQKGEDSKVKAMLAVSAYKREYAFNLGVDVYSSNQVLQEELNRVGWAGAAGSLGFSAAMAPLGTAGKVVTYSRLGKQLNDYLRELPPSKIRKYAYDKLAAMGVSKNDIKKFLETTTFTPRHTIVIVSNLMQLKNARGRDVFIRYATSASDEEQANFMMNIAETMRGYNEKVSPIRDIILNSGLILASAENNSVMIPLPLDYGVWTERADKILNNIIKSYNAPKGKVYFELWVTGAVSPLAKQSLEKIGIKITEHIVEKIDFMD
jgi:hypothetical protein